MKERIEQLEKEKAALGKIVRVLMARVERSVDSSGDAYAIFERNIVLQKSVEDRTRELEEKNIQLAAALYEFRIAEERERSFINAASDMAFIKDAGFRYIMINDAYRGFFGRPADEILGKTDFDLMPEVVAEGCRLTDEQALRDETLIVSSEAFGDRIYETRKFPVPLGSAWGVGAFIRDVTEQKIMYEQLRESEEKYSLIANAMADTVSILDMQLRFTFISPSVFKLRGFTVDEAMGQTLDQVLTPESLNTTYKVLREEVEKEADGTADPDRTRSLELQEYRKDGTIIWVGNSLSFLRGREGNPYGILVVSRDISEMKNAEEALKKSSEEKEVLLRELQHRVKNNLSFVASMLSLEKERLPDEASQKVFSSMQSRIHSIVMLYDQLYGSSELASVNIGVYLERLVGSIDESCGGGHVKLLTVPVEARLDMRRAVPLGIIINELVTNAIKYAGSEKKESGILVELAPREGGFTICVSDNGPGLPDGFDINRVVSMGLRLVSMLARQIGGAFRHEKGYRSCFYVDVPHSQNPRS